MIYDSPLFSNKHNLEVAIGSIHFNEGVIKNLREQIKNLREALSFYVEDQTIYFNQYKHLS
jgi:hypothetical protein